ncbi:MAG: ABC transporter substrate-binding protein [Acidimicrobiales bacterium]
MRISGRARRPAFAAVAVASGAMLLAACGGGGGGSPTTTAAPGGSTNTTSGGGGHLSGVIHFGDVAPLSGLDASLGQAITQGMKAAAYVINSNGGVMGKKLVVDPTDTKGDPADATTALTQEITLNHPAALVGPVTLGIHGVQPVFDRFQVPDGWNGGSAEYDHNNDPYLWRCNPSDSQEGVAISAFGWNKGYKTAALLFTSTAASQSFEPIISNVYKKLGGKIVASETLTPGLSSYSTELSKILAAHPQVIFSQLESSTGATVFKNFQQLGGLHVPMLSTDLMAGSDVIKAIGPQLDKKSMLMVQGSNALTGAAAAYTTVYKKVNHQAPQAGAGYAYDCTLDFALAITKAHSTTGSAINAAMTQVSNPPGTQVSSYATGVADIKAGKKIDYQGVSGPMDFNQYHNVVGPWDVVQATGDAAGDVSVVKTIPPSKITSVLQKIGQG